MCYYEIQILGKFQSWPNGTDCKSVSLAFSGSNPLFPTNLRVQLSGRAPAFQAGCEGPIPFTRSNMRLQLSWIEQRTSNPCVRGSTPLRRAMLGYSQVGKAPDFDSGMRRFESCYPSQFDPLAQSVEHLTFNQGVRSSNLRWVTINIFQILFSGYTGKLNRQERQIFSHCISRLIHQLSRQST